jgi:hypothetical protein
VPVGQSIALIFAAGETGASARARARRRAVGARTRDQGLAAGPEARRGAWRGSDPGEDGRREDREGRRSRPRRAAAGARLGQRRGLTRRGGAASRRLPQGARAWPPSAVSTWSASRLGPRGRHPQRGYSRREDVRSGGGRARGREGRGRQQCLAHHGRAHDGQLDQRAALLPGARGQCEPPRGLAREGRQADRRADHLHGSPGAARRGGPRAASGANVSWKDGSLVRHPEVNIGLAVALEDGWWFPCSSARTRWASPRSPRAARTS